MRCRGCSSRATLLLLFALCLPAHADFHQDVLIVDLRFNGEPYGDAFVLTDEAGEYFVEESWLTRWEVLPPWPAVREHAGTRYYPVGRFSGATAVLDRSRLSLDITMPPDLLPLRVVDLRAAELPAASANFGAYLDYDWNYRQQSAGVDTLSALLRPVVFGPQGNLVSNLLVRETSGRRADRYDRDGDGLTVLDLTYTRDDPGTLRSLRVGDVVSAGGLLGRSLRLGGLQFATNFATQPTLVTYPLPSFYGQSTVPTALDVYINGQLTKREQVAPGNFILEGIPVITGAGQMQIVTEDALGRQQLFVQDFYVAPELLRRGLSDYSFSVGALRENYALDSFVYGDVAGSATWRQGLRDDLTVEGRIELTNGLAGLAGGAQLAWGQGILTGGLALSSGQIGAGAGWLVGYGHADRDYSYNLRLAGNSRKYTQVGLTDALPAFEFFASGGMSAPIRGSIGAAVTHQAYREGTDRSILSLNYSTSFANRLSASAVFSWISAERKDFTLALSISMPFGADHSFSGGLSTGKDGSRVQLEARRNLPPGPGYGYNVSVAAADGTYVNAGATAQNEFAMAQVGLRSGEGASEWNLGSSGSLATLGGTRKATRQIRDAFAVVEVGDYEGVRVYSENREVGRTDENGRLFIPGLRPYQRNQISIEVDDLPLSARIGPTRSETAPYLRSGVIVEFEVTEARDAIIRARLPDGSPVREGAVGRVFGQPDWSPVGSDGKLYLHGLEQPSQVTIRWNGSICDFVVPRPEGPEMIPDLGEFTCEPREFE